MTKWYSKKCEFDYDSKAYTCGSNNTGMCPDAFKIPIVDTEYFETVTLDEKCRCIEKIKLSLEELAKKEPAKYNAYLNIYTKKYSENKCDEALKNIVQSNIENIYSSVTKEDKARIEAQSIKERNQRIYIGVAVFIVAIGMVSIYSTRNS
jgi:hypothetical protein